MASKICAGLVLFAVLHHGLAYSIWGSRSNQDATLDATLEAFQSVNRNSGSPDIMKESKDLANKLYTLFKQVHGLNVDVKEWLNDKASIALSEVVNIVRLWSGDAKLKAAEEAFHSAHGLFDNDYQWFLKGNMTLEETESLIQDALRLDSDQSSKQRDELTRFYQLYLGEYEAKLQKYRKRLGNTHALLNEFLNYNQRNEWHAFILMTTAYKLKSLESNDQNYVKEFQRLRKQLMDKLEMHEKKYLEALATVKEV